MGSNDRFEPRPLPEWERRRRYGKLRPMGWTPGKRRCVKLRLGMRRAWAGIARFFKAWHALSVSKDCIYGNPECVDSSCEQCFQDRW